MSATVKHVPSTSSGNLDAYLEREKEGNDLPRVLFEAGQRCRPETAAQEFRELREAYGQQGAVRTVNGKYVRPEDPAEATHLKVGKNWREAKAGEAATHQRIAPAVPYVKRDEAHHFIYSFDLATVNPEDPEQAQRAFEAVVAFREEYTPGTQNKFVAHGDALGSQEAIERGEGGKFHVHEAMNAVVHDDMEVEGRQYRRGQRVAGAITHVDTYREAWDQFLETRGHEFGLSPQDRSVLPEVGSPEYRAVRRTDQDHWAKERGELSDHDRARRGMETAYAKLAEDPQRVASLSPSARIELLAEEVAATGDAELKLRQQKNGEVKIRSFVVPDRAQAIGHTKLGERYSQSGAVKRLELIAQGQWEPYTRGEVGPPKRIAKLARDEVDELQRAADEMAAAELDAQRGEERQPDLSPSRQRDRGQGAEEVDLGPDDPVVVEPAENVEKPQTPERDESADRDQTEREDSDRDIDVKAALPDAGADAERRTPAAARPAGPRPERRPRMLTDGERRSAELIAVVRSERGDGGAYVDFQLAAGPDGIDRPGLHLMAEKTSRKRADGSQQEVTRTWTQLTAQQYDRLKQVAGDNQVEADGQKVYAFAADINLSLKGGYVPNVNAMQSSRRARIDEDVLDKQRASEDRGRETEKTALEQRRNAPSVYDQIDAAHRTREKTGWEY